MHESHVALGRFDLAACRCPAGCRSRKCRVLLPEDRGHHRERRIRPDIREGDYAMSYSGYSDDDSPSLAPRYGFPEPLRPDGPTMAAGRVNEE
jgi:hypothetical protein